MKDKVPPTWYVAKTAYSYRNLYYSSSYETQISYKPGDVIRKHTELARQKHEQDYDYFILVDSGQIILPRMGDLIQCSNKKEALKLAKRLKKAKFIA